MFCRPSRFLFHAISPTTHIIKRNNKSSKLLHIIQRNPRINQTNSIPKKRNKKVHPFRMILKKNRKRRSETMSRIEYKHIAKRDVRCNICVEWSFWVFSDYFFLSIFPKRYDNTYTLSTQGFITHVGHCLWRDCEWKRIKNIYYHRQSEELKFP